MSVADLVLRDALTDAEWRLSAAPHGSQPAIWVIDLYPPSGPVRGLRLDRQDLRALAAFVARLADGGQ